MGTEKFIDLKVLDYSISPGPRYCSQGEESGEDFYHKLLNKAFYDAYEQGAKLRINLDGPDGYASSFLDEAFGNLVYDFTKELVLKYVQIISDEEPEWIDMIQNDTYNEWEKRRKNAEEPTYTKEHDAWYRVNSNNKIELKKWK